MTEKKAESSPPKKKKADQKSSKEMAEATEKSNRAVAAKVTMLRESRRFSMGDLCREMKSITGFARHVSSLSRIERIEGSATLIDILAMSRIFGVTLEWLIDPDVPLSDVEKQGKIDHDIKAAWGLVLQLGGVEAMRRLAKVPEIPVVKIMIESGVQGNPRQLTHKVRKPKV